MYDNYSLEISKILKGAELEMINLHHAYVGTEHLLLSIIKNNQKLASILEKFNLTYDKFKQELIAVVGNSNNKKPVCIYTQLLKRVIKEAQDLAKNTTMQPSHLLISLLEEGEGIAFRIMLSLNVDIDALYEEIKNKDSNKSNNLELYNIGKDFNEIVNEEDVLIGREKELNLIIETLIRKNKNNPLLVGDAGVGKTAIVEELARRINKGEVPNSLKNKRIVSLEMSSLVAGTKYRGEFEEKLGKIIKELENNPNIILFIDEIHTMTNAGGAEGAINASDILKPYLARGKVKIIGATTTGEYNKFIVKDKALNRRFELIKISEPNLEETKNILRGLIPSFKNHYNINITEENINDIAKLSNRFILNRYNPDKSIDLLDSICAMKEVENTKEEEKKNLKKELNKLIKRKEEMVLANNFKDATILRIKEIKLSKKIKNIDKIPKKITSDDIKQAIYRKINIPILTNKENIFDKLNNYLQNNIIGQKEGIEKIIKTLKTYDEEAPLSILITGSTGVGKTKTIKEICDFLHLPLIRLDMSEYNSEITINRLVGASAGYVGYDDENIFDKVKINPNACILLDEVEKAHPRVLNLFLQILDEGFVTNAKGEKIDFKNTYIFMTSNAKCSQNIGFLKASSNYQNNFSKEFIARITKIINYKNIDENTIKKYLLNKGITDINIIKDFDYSNMGLRGLDKYLKENKIKVN